MRRPPLPFRLPALSLLPLAAVALAACGTTTQTSKYKGAEHEVAQAVANLQSNVTGGEQAKVCSRDLAAPIVARLGGKKACEEAIKEQLAEVDSTELEVESVKVSGDTATATVKSIYGGKKKLDTITLAKEGGSWKIVSVAH